MWKVSGPDKGSIQEIIFFMSQNIAYEYSFEYIASLR